MLIHTYLLHQKHIYTPMGDQTHRGHYGGLKTCPHHSQDWEKTALPLSHSCPQNVSDRCLLKCLINFCSIVELYAFTEGVSLSAWTDL